MAQNGTQQAHHGLQATQNMSGAYLAFTQNQAYEQAFNAAFDAAIANGATQDMASAMAQQAGEQAAQQAGQSGLSAVASSALQVIPFIGAGLAIGQDIAQHGAPTEQSWYAGTGLAAATISPAFLFPAGLALGASFLDDQEGPPGHVDWWQPDLRVIGQDGPVTYLVDAHIGDFQPGQWYQGFGDVPGAQAVFAYNTETNELQAFGRPHYAGQNGELAGYDFSLELGRRGGANQEGYSLEYKNGGFVVVRTISGEYASTYSQEIGSVPNEEVTAFLSGGLSAPDMLRRAGVDPSVVQEFSTTGEQFGANNWKPYSGEYWRAPGRSERGIAMYNPSALQAAIYNEVLLPQGLVPTQTDLTPIAMDGQQYLVDGAGGLYSVDGRILGSVDQQTGNVYSFQASGPSGGLGDGTINPIEYQQIGTVSDWGAYSPTQAVADTSGQPWGGMAAPANEQSPFSFMSSGGMPMSDISNWKPGDPYPSALPTSTTQITDARTPEGIAIQRLFMQQYQRLMQQMERGGLTEPVQPVNFGGLNVVPGGQIAARENQLKGILGEISPILEAAGRVPTVYDTNNIGLMYPALQADLAKQGVQLETASQKAIDENRANLNEPSTFDKILQGAMAGGYALQVPGVQGILGQVGTGLWNQVGSPAWNWMQGLWNAPTVVSGRPV